MKFKTNKHAPLSKRVVDLDATEDGELPTGYLPVAACHYDLLPVGGDTHSETRTRHGSHLGPSVLIRIIAFNTGYSSITQTCSTWLEFGQAIFVIA